MSGGRARGSRVLASAHVAGALVAGYHAVLTAAAWWAVAARRTSVPLPPSPRHRFVVLVPAHDEERSIGATLKSLATLDYPADLVAVHVVADHCTDGTAAVVRANGMEVHERDDPAGAGKGPALQWLLGRLAAEPFDAAVFVDADTTVEPGFLRVADAHLGRGADAIQSYYAVRDPGTSPAVGLRAAALAARHYLRPLGRAQLGASAGLYGNGMVLRRAVLERHGWSGHLTEDVELHLALLLAGTGVTFAPDATVAAEMPATLEAARTQHERWERGRLQTARRFVPSLLRRAARGGPLPRAAYADAVADQLVPPLSVVIAGHGALTLLALVHAVRRPSRRARRGVAVAAALGAVEAAYVLSALRMAGAPRSVYRSLLAAPRLVLWKVGLWTGVVAGGRDITWVRTARNDEDPPWT